MRYIETEVLSEEDGSDAELVARESDNETDKVIKPCPTKKAKVSKRAVLVEDKSASTKAKECKSVKPKTAKSESKENGKSKKKKKEKKGGLLKEKYVHVYQLTVICSY